MLIAIPQHSPLEIERWNSLERGDSVVSGLRKQASLVNRSVQAISTFTAESSSGYCGVSWGKDSVVVAHMIAALAKRGGPVIPLVWVRVERAENPHCPLVRDAFLRAYDHPYREIEVALNRRKGHLTSEAGFKLAANMFGNRHISGVRADESSVRMLRCMKHGEVSAGTCAPLSWWKAENIFAYLYANNLPVHPAYAFSMDGLLPREHLRVASLGGERGTGWGRREWEMRYYPTEMLALAEGQP